MGALYSVQMSETTLSAASEDLLIQLVAGDDVMRGRLRYWGVSFQGVTAANEPVRIRLERYSDAATGASTPTPSKWNGRGTDSITAKITAQVFDNAHAATTVEVLEEHLVTPNGGLLAVMYPIDLMPEWGLDGAADYIGIAALANDAVVASAFMVWEE